jgi:hypothetical protein
LDEYLMATRYLIFASEAAAINASQADWAQRILGHPTLSTAVTKQLWQVISNAAGTIGVIPDIALPGLSAAELAALVDATNPTVQAVLTQERQPPPGM